MKQLFNVSVAIVFMVIVMWVTVFDVFFDSTT